MNPLIGYVIIFHNHNHYMKAHVNIIYYVTKIDAIYSMNAGPCGIQCLEALSNLFYPYPLVGS